MHQKLAFSLSPNATKGGSQYTFLANPEDKPFLSAINWRKPDPIGQVSGENFSTSC